MSTDAQRIGAALSDPRLRKLLGELEAASKVDRPGVLRRVRELCAQLALDEAHHLALLAGWAKAFGLSAATATWREGRLAEARAEAKAAREAATAAGASSRAEEDETPEP